MRAYTLGVPVTETHLRQRPTEDRPLTAGGRGFPGVWRSTFFLLLTLAPVGLAMRRVLYSACRTDRRRPNVPNICTRSAHNCRRRVGGLSRETDLVRCSRVGIAFGPGSPWTAACQHMAVAAAQPLLQQLRAEHQVAARGLEKVRKWHRLSATNL